MSGRRKFFVRASWDEEAQAFISESNIDGLHIQADTIEQFEEVLDEYAVELIMENHILAEEMVSKPMKDWLPSILWQLPSSKEQKRPSPASLGEVAATA